MIRVFVALPLPPDTRRALASLQAALPDGRLADPDNLHVTLAFLGDQREDVLEDLHLALDAIAIPPFALTIDGLGAFGKFPPRVLYAAISPDPALSHLRRKVRTAVRHSGIDLPHERFVPHVTLARFNTGLTEDEAIGLDKFIAARAGLRLPPFPVTSFAIYRSTLGRSGATYDELVSYQLPA